jgi:hypothetical protein
MAVFDSALAERRDGKLSGAVPPRVKPSAPQLTPQPD